MSSSELLSWLGDPDVSVMSEDGHIVMTHRSVLGLYSSSFRHLLSINPADGGQCMIICHDVDAMKLEEMVRNATLNFQRFTSEEHQDEYVDIEEHLTKLKPVSSDLLPIQSAVNETLAAKEEFEQSQDVLDSITRPKDFKVDDVIMINEKHNTAKTSPIKQNSIKWINIEEVNNLDSITRPKTFKAENENMINEKHNTEKITLIKENWINIEEVNNYNDKSSEARKEYESLDRFGQIDIETKRLACKLCDKTYEGHYPRENLRKHVDSVHMEKYLSCRFCRKEFFSVITFMQHYRLHLSKEKYRCEKCGMNPGCKTKLIRHIQTVHLNQKNFKCKLCDNTFKNKASLSGHIQSKHEDKQFSCQYCDHTSVNEVSLNRHIKLKHENSRSYKCKDCDYVCYRQDYLTRHVRSIHENVRFPCDQCEYQATRKQYLESHIKKVHKKPI